MIRKGNSYILTILLLLFGTVIEAGEVCASGKYRHGREAVPTEPSIRDFYPDTAHYAKYNYVKVLDTWERPTVSDDEFYKKSKKVVFIVNKIDIRENQSSIRELVDKVIPQINSDSLELEYMLVRGAASPEGPWRFNVWLGEHRCKQLFDYINARLKFPAREGRYSQSSVPEDYEGLVRMMKDAHDPLTKRVEEIVDKYSETEDYATLKTTLKRMDHGRVWRRLLKKYFPELRSAKVMFFFKKHHREDEDIVKYDLFPAKPVKIKPTVEFKPVYLTMPEIEPLPSEDGRLVRRHILALRSNLLYDFFYMPGHYWAPSPNIQVEYYPKSGHITANFGLTCPYWHWWSRNQFWQIRDYVFEGRYYIKGGGQFIGPYVSAYVHTNIYGIGLSKTKGWEGEGLGGGVMGGYTMHISKNKRWRLEFSLGLGFYTSKYDPYVYGNTLTNEEDGLYYYKYYGKKADFKERNHRFNWFGPTNIGIHLTYDVLYRRIQKKGVSVNRTEAIINKKGGRR